MSDADPLAVAGRVKRERTARGWTLDELARRTGVPSSSLWKIEHGTRPVRVAEVVAFAEAFGGMPVEEMFTPLWALDDREAQRLLDAISGSMARIYTAAGDLVESVRELAEVRDRNGKAFTYVINHLRVEQQRATTTGGQTPLRDYASHLVTRLIPTLIDEGWAHGTPQTAFEPDPDFPDIWRQVGPIELGSHIVPHPSYDLDDDQDIAEPAPEDDQGGGKHGERS